MKLMGTFALTACVVLAQGRGGRGGQNPNGAPAAANPATQVRTGPAPEEHFSVTKHKARVGGQEIAYTATAGTYVIRSDDGQPKASMFFVAYTKDDVADQT